MEKNSEHAVSRDALTLTKFSNENPVIIFGAGIIGELLYTLLSTHGVDVACFCDNSSSKAGSVLCGIDVLSFPSMKAKFKNPIFVISAADIQDVVDQLDTEGFSNWVAGGEILKTINISDLPLDLSDGFVEFAIGACLNCHNAFLNPGKVFFRSVDIVITERCTMKCKDCSNLMQYYDAPVDVEFDEIINSIDRVCDIADDIHEIRVIGGEPLVNKKYPAVIDHITQKPNVKRVVIYTNGTIVPKLDAIKSLQHEKVIFLITDYGDLSKNSVGLKNMLIENRIKFYIRPASGWTECGSITKHHRSKEEQKSVFGSCCAKGLYTLSAGKLYRCPFSANAVRLGAIPDFKEDHVELLNGDVSLRNKREQVQHLMGNDQYLLSCDYCNGRSLDDPQIEPAIQVKKPLEFIRIVSE